MLRSHNQQELEFDFFISFLEHAISGDSKYKDLVQPIILDVAQVINEQKEVTQLDRIGLNVKILLFKKANTLLKDVNQGNMDNTLLQNILTIVSENRKHAFA